MSFKKIAAFCLALLLAGSALAAETMPPEEEAEIRAAIAQEEAERAEPFLSPEAGGAGLVLLLALGAVKSHRRRAQDDASYAAALEEDRMEDPYTRLEGMRKRKRWF